MQTLEGFPRAVKARVAEPACKLMVLSVAPRGDDAGRDDHVIEDLDQGRDDVVDLLVFHGDRGLILIGPGHIQATTQKSLLVGLFLRQPEVGGIIPEITHAQVLDTYQPSRGHIAVVDTHLLLHFLPPEQVDWKEVVGVEPVRLFLPITVVNELDELKYTGKDRVRGKARAALTNLERAVGPGGSPGSVKEGVTIEVELAYSDDPRDPDADRSIISVCIELEQIAGNPNCVSLVTGDAGMRLRAAQRDVRVVPMPEKYLREPGGGGE